MRTGYLPLWYRGNDGTSLAGGATGGGGGLFGKDNLAELVAECLDKGLGLTLDVCHLGVSGRDVLGDLDEQAPERTLHDRAVKGRVPGERTDAQLAVLGAQKVERRHSIQIEKAVRACQPEIHRRDETLAAGNHLSDIAKFREQCNHAIDRRRRVILERSGFHRG